MKPLPKILLALTAVAALPVAYPAKANLITNPGFEAGLGGGWVTPTPGNVFVIGTFGTISPHSGSLQASCQGEGIGQLFQTFANDAGPILHG